MAPLKLLSPTQRPEEAGEVLWEQSWVPVVGQRRVSVSMLCSLCLPLPLPERQPGPRGGSEDSHQSQVACAAVSASELEGEDCVRVTSTCVKCLEQLLAGRGHQRTFASELGQASN